jgi:hypothetical protein
MSQLIQDFHPLVKDEIQGIFQEVFPSKFKEKETLRIIQNKQPKYQSIISIFGRKLKSF